VKRNNVIGGVGLPLNLGILEGSLVGIFGQVGSCNMVSFVSFVKYGILRDAKYCMEGRVPTISCDAW
jgi:hypothetical protein